MNILSNMGCALLCSNLFYYKNNIRASQIYETTKRTELFEDEFTGA